MTAEVGARDAVGDDFGQRVVDDLVRLLDLESIEENIFRGLSPKVSLQRVFGGQVAGQALVAAGRTVERDRIVHSLHSYFIRPGDPSVPIVYTVDRVRDGRSFSTRRVVAVQHGKSIFSLSASFQLPQEGIDHQSPMPESPPPESLPRAHDKFSAESADRAPLTSGTPRRITDSGHWPFDVRYVDKPPWGERAGGPTSSQQYRVWMKATGRLPTDPMLHACALTFASDLIMLDTVLARHGLSMLHDPLRMASLDHALWFHRPFRADEWLLYSAEAPSASGGRGLSLGRIFDESGHHVATVVQEGMIRLRGGQQTGPADPVSPDS
ncbi:MAG TPA: acyl-CoA thioesterase II [Jatrophihabitantaceae bacterium]|nr:acyl-CoA thioesterase II [Jatrophihabitantaceae bacterium]